CELDSLAARPATFDRPEHIREAHLARRQLGHYRDLDVSQARRPPAIRCDAGQRPRGAFVIHDAARAVDWIDNDADLRIVLARATGKNFQTFDIRTSLNA